MRRVAGLVGQVELDLEPDRAPVGVEARLAQHPREHVEAGAHLLPVALAVLASEDRGLDLLSHGVTLSSAVHVYAVHLHDVQAVPGPPARQAGARGHLAVLPTRGQDRRARAERRRASPPCCGSWPGQDTDYRGDAQLAPGATVGLLEQEPQLDPDKDVRGNVEDGVRELRDMLDRFNELAANYSDETADEFARLQDAIDAADAWNLDTTLEIAMDALRLPPRRRRRRDALRRRAAPRRAVPAAARRARPAAARRAHEPPRRRVGGLAREAPRGLQGHGRGGHPRPLLPRQRRRLDPRARPRPRPPLQGQLHRLARAEAGAARPGGAPRAGARRARSRASSSGCASRRRAGAPRRAPA